MNIGNVSKERRIINTRVNGLIRSEFGCYDAAIETINAELGTSVNKATLTHRKQGIAGWPVEEVMVLEAVSGRYPITRMMERNRDEHQRAASNLCPFETAGQVAKETGEAVQAIIKAAKTKSDTDAASGITEIDEAIAILKSARDYLEGRS